MTSHLHASGEIYPPDFFCMQGGFAFGRHPGNKESTIPGAMLVQELQLPVTFLRLLLSVAFLKRRIEG
jgi:hypothetical protein